MTLSSNTSCIDIKFSTIGLEIGESNPQIITEDDIDELMNEGQDTNQLIDKQVLIFSHSSRLFKKIRKLDKISDQELLRSLDSELNQEMVFTAGQNSGQSGSFFFFSHDKRLIIKTMRNDESKDFLKSLESYYQHLKENKDSLLCRIYGLFTIKMENVDPVKIVLMQNTLKIQEMENLVHVFDLKGSTWKRITKK